jgi:hypothetical protein
MATWSIMATLVKAQMFQLGSNGHLVLWNPINKEQMVIL